MYENRTLVRGDNLEEMRRFPDDCIDLIATDPRLSTPSAIISSPTATNTDKNPTPS